MTDEHPKELADYRLQQARETMQEAEGLLGTFWNCALNQDIADL